MADERYALYGVIPTEREANTSAMTLAEQTIGDRGDVLIYETDDREEARAIYEAGGFEKEGVWNAVTRVVDRHKRSAVKTMAQQPVRQPSKRDYDQT